MLPNHEGEIRTKVKKYIVASAGDDGAVAISILELHHNIQDASISILSWKLCWRRVISAAALKGIRTDGRVVVTSGTEQRLFVIKVVDCINDEKYSLVDATDCNPDTPMDKFKPTLTFEDTMKVWKKQKNLPAVVSCVNLEVPDVMCVDVLSNDCIENNEISVAVAGLGMQVINIPI